MKYKYLTLTWLRKRWALTGWAGYRDGEISSSWLAAPIISLNESTSWLSGGMWPLVVFLAVALRLRSFVGLESSWCTGTTAFGWWFVKFLKNPKGGDISDCYSAGCLWSGGRFKEGVVYLHKWPHCTQGSCTGHDQYSTRGNHVGREIMIGTQEWIFLVI